MTQDDLQAYVDQRAGKMYVSTGSPTFTGTYVTPPSAPVRLPPKFDNEVAAAVYRVLRENNIYNAEQLANAAAGEVARVHMNEAFDVTMKVKEYEAPVEQVMTVASGVITSGMINALYNTTASSLNANINAKY